MIKLGVNIDHIATLRQARRTYEPDPVWGAVIAELAGADGITVHLREDRRHIQDRDVILLRQSVQTKLNLEMGNSLEIVDIACDVKPDQVTLVPEKREEVTTEGGLDVVRHFDSLKQSIKKFKKSGIKTSMFIDPQNCQVEASKKAGAEFVEFHTGTYANALSEEDVNNELNKLVRVCEAAHKIGLRVNAGHGLTYKNVQAICQLPYLEELNIGHSIISRSVFVGLSQAVMDMRKILEKYS